MIIGLFFYLLRVLIELIGRLDARLCICTQVPVEPISGSHSYEYNVMITI